ncbi:uncharacterized protein LOC132913241 [Bombus pascuorum]|uniref:uncharacterized protein LOC132913241 n=1 Tax=Bombus pascuorum TaxID=65598 RepID=UPI00213ACEEC|nr:uncharacterized protein LOC132913241 [Bombus pascuorum]
MRNVRGNVFCYLIVALLFLAPSSYADVSAENATSQFQRCDINKAMDQCGENERCFKNSENEEAQCRCVRGFEADGGQCVQVTTFPNVIIDQSTIEVHSGGSSIAAGLFILTFLIVMSVLLYFVEKRYKWLQRVRQLRSNHYGNVLVTRDDDDDDDSPIA